MLTLMRGTGLGDVAVSDMLDFSANGTELMSAFGRPGAFSLVDGRIGSMSRLFAVRASLRVTDSRGIDGMSADRRGHAGRSVVVSQERACCDGARGTARV